MNYLEAQKMTREGKLPIMEGTCERCLGWGYTKDEAPVIENGKTVSLGSACPRCKGTTVDPDYRR